MKILNLTQHPATEEQKKAGVVDLKGKELEELRKIITFDEMPSSEDLHNASIRLVGIAHDKGFKDVLIGGACYFMPVLHHVLKVFNMTPYYAYSKRNAVDKYVGDKIVTEYCFEHEGFIEVKFMNEAPEES